VWWRASFSPTRSSAVKARSRRSPQRHAAVDQRQLDVLERRGAGQQVEALEHEAEEVPPQQRALAARQGADVDALEQVAPASAGPGSR
jgi:sarcosine oxidase gamma subunit